MCADRQADRVVAIVDEVRRILADPDSVTVPASASGGCRVIVGCFQMGRLIASKAGRGRSIAAAAQRAAARLATDPRVTLRRTDPDLVIEIWVQEPGEVDPGEFDPGIHGITGADGRLWRPSVPLTRSDPGATGRPPAFVGDGGAASIHRWHHYLASPGIAPVELLRLRPQPQPVTRAACEASIAAACTRLMSVQAESGAYRYVDHAFTDPPGTSMNIVRLAGTAYSMALASTRADDPVRAAEVSASAGRAIDCLLGYRVDFGGGWLIRRSEGSRPVPAGAAALTLLAMQYGSLREHYIAERRQLRDGLLSLQDRDGRFRGTDTSRSAREETSTQNYFPGETMLALMHEAEHGDGLAYAAVTRAFPCYVEHFRAAPHVAFALWQADVWWRVWRMVGGASGDPAGDRYADFVREIADFLLPRQQRSSEALPQRRGGFGTGRKIPGIASACFTEAVIRAYLVSRGTSRAARYRKAARLGVEFVASLQIDPAIAGILPRPNDAVGAFPSSLVDFTLRNDNDQHAITMLAAAADAPDLLDVFHRR